MSIPQFIRDNTNDGRDIVTLLIDVLNGRIAGCKLSHQLTAARLLIIYGSQSAVAGHDDAPGFIADNTPDREPRDKQWLTIDPALARLIRIKTDDGRDLCLFLIDVMQGRVEGINPGHRVSAARELLSRAFGKTPSRPLPKPQRLIESPRSTRSTQPASGSVHAETVASAPAAPTAVLTEPKQEPGPEAEAKRRLLIDLDNDPRFTVFDSEIYEFMNECDDPDFDPYLAALDEDYFKSYTACKDPECEVHGDPPEIDFDPNDYHY